MNERLSGSPKENVPRQPSLEVVDLYDTKIDLNNKLEVLGEAADIELDVLGGNIDGLSDDEINKKVALAERLLPALVRFGEKSLDQSEGSIIDSQIRTLTDFAETHKKPQLQ